MRNPAMKGVVFEVDSFGGELAGAFETADWPQPNGCRHGVASSARQAWWCTIVGLNALTDAGPILSAWKQATSYR